MADHGDRNHCEICGHRIRYVIAQGTRDGAPVGRWIHTDRTNWDYPHAASPADGQL